MPSLKNSLNHQKYITYYEVMVTKAAINNL